MTIRDDALTAWAAAVHQALCTDKAYRVLDGCGREFTFTSGGCWMLAEALRRLAGGRVWAVYNGQGNVDHVILRVGDLYLDFAGCQTRDQVLAWSREEGVRRPRLGPFVRHRAGDIIYDEGTVRRLAAYLRRACGQPPPPPAA